MSIPPPSEVARLEERRQAEVTAELATEAERVGGGWMTFTDPGSWTNQACGLGLDGPVAGEDIDGLIDFYASRGVEPRIEVCPFADETLVRGLAERGFVVREFETVLVRDCKPRRGTPRGIDGVTIEQVDPSCEERAREIVEVSRIGFYPEPEEVPAVFDEVMRRVLQHPRTIMLVARAADAVVGVGGMEVAAGVGYLFGATVLPAFRQRGIQTALVEGRIAVARERDCSFVCIHSRPGIATERNALRLGFSVAYTKVAMVRPGAGLLPSP